MIGATAIMKYSTVGGVQQVDISQPTSKLFTSGKKKQRCNNPDWC
jgi:hypothetical protein